MMPTIHAAAADIRAGRLSPVHLLGDCLERIDRFESKVQAWAHLDPAAAIATAEKLAREIKHGHYRGPLHGIPVGIKDIIDVFDWPTACGSKLWANSIARRDATAVERLRRAGAIIVGKTVTTMYASFDPPPTRNPWNPELTAGGSSSGSAAAVACGMCLASLGTQTGGSITRPASYCGVAACKPTFGRVSLDGVLPLAPSMDHVGAMAADGRDVAILLQTVGGPDPRDPGCSGRPMPDLLWRLEQPLTPPRLAWAPHFCDDLTEESVQAVMADVLARLPKAGASIREITLPAGFAEVVGRQRTVMAVEAGMYHEARLRRHPSDYGPKVTALIEEGLECPAPEYGRCKEQQRRLREELDACLSHFDGLLLPASIGPAPPAATTGDPAFSTPWSFTGSPSVSIPAAWTDDGLPLCIQLVGSGWSERELFAAAAWCEDVLHFERRLPTD
jgi:aspartyl-tRNA(Asn)/glutamyl-tRNA(Gln) amidotransferase subunit A